MQTETNVKPSSSDFDFEEDLVHFYCECDENTALCGTDITDDPKDSEEEEVNCVVCIDLVEFPCPRCGD